MSLNIAFESEVKSSLNLVLLLENNITTVLLFVAAAAAERVYGP